MFINFGILYMQEISFGGFMKGHV